MSKIKDTKEQYFTAFFEKNENDGYTVTVPSLPGLVTEGKNFEEAKKMAKDAVTCYVQGLKKAKQKEIYETEIGSFRIAVSI